MEKKEFLNEERYQQTKKKIAKLALIILIIGCIAGVGLITIGINKNKAVEEKYSQLENETQNKKEQLPTQIQEEKERLEERREELEAQGVEYDVVAEYTDGDAYELKLIVNVLDPSFAYYKFDEYQNNTATAKYCSLMNEYEELNDGFSESTRENEEEHEKAGNYAFFAFGGMIIFMSLIIAGSVYMTSKGREITAFQAQQVMPVAQEGIEKMAPTMAKVSKTMAEEMAPTYGEIAKEIAKGIKEGMKEDK